MNAIAEFECDFSLMGSLYKAASTKTTGSMPFQKSRIS
jgi:hypothetical protein